MALGAISIAEHVHRVAERYPVYVALHTDHCQADKLDNTSFRWWRKRSGVGPPGYPTSSAATCSTAALCRQRKPGHRRQAPGTFQENELILEIEAGVVGGDKDGVKAEATAKLYTTPEDTLEVARRLNPKGARYLLAATFGNVHGVYKPGAVQFKPAILRECQEAVVRPYGERPGFTWCFTAARVRN